MAVLLLIHDSCTSLVGFPFPSLYFYLTKSMGSLALKCHDPFQNKINRKVTHVCYQSFDF